MAVLSGVFSPLRGADVYISEEHLPQLAIVFPGTANWDREHPVAASPHGRRVQYVLVCVAWGYKLVGCMGRTEFCAGKGASLGAATASRRKLVTQLPSSLSLTLLTSPRVFSML
jgi:hypothetical protein